MATVTVENILANGRDPAVIRRNFELLARMQTTLGDAINANSDHGSLSGLLDDDHSQYALLSGRNGDIYLVDEINEFTTNAGVTIEGVLLKDTQVTAGLVNASSSLGATMTWGGTAQLGGSANEIKSVSDTAGVWEMRIWGPDASTRGLFEFWTATGNSAVSGRVLASDTDGNIVVDNDIIVRGGSGVTQAQVVSPALDQVELQDSAAGALANFTQTESTFPQVRSDTIVEDTVGAGVTIDSVLLKDGGITLGGHAVNDWAVDGDSWGTEDSIGVTKGYLADFIADPADTQEPTGFPATNTDTTTTFTDGTRLFEIAPSGSEFSFYLSGKKFTKSATESVNWTDVEGIHFIVYNSSGNLEVSHVSAFADQTEIIDYILKDNVFVAEIYWDATNNISLQYEERHGLMPWPTHVNLHLAEGTRYLSGLGIGGITPDANGNDDSHAQFSGSSGIILDEDIRNDVLAKATTGNIVTLWQEGTTGTWRWNVDSAPVVTTGSGRPAWNENVGGTWQLTEVDNNDFVLAHIFASNETRYGGYIAIIGQAEYDTTGAARQGATTEIADLVTQGLPFPEFVAVATIIYQGRNANGNTWKARTRTTDEGDDYISWLGTVISSGSQASDHGALAGLSDDDHSQYALLAGRSGDALSIDTINEYTADAGVTVEGVLLKDNDVSTSGDIGVLDSAASYIFWDRTDTGDYWGVNVSTAGDLLFKHSSTSRADMKGQTSKIRFTSDDRILVDTIDEATSAAGVTIDSVLLKDAEVVFGASAYHRLADSSVSSYFGIETVASNLWVQYRINSGTIIGYAGFDSLGNFEFYDGTPTKLAEITSAGVFLIDDIQELTSAAGVTIDSVLLKDGGATFTENVQINTDNKDYRAGRTSFAWGTSTTIGVRMLAADGTASQPSAGWFDFRRWTGTATTHHTAGIAQVLASGNWRGTLKWDSQASNTFATTDIFQWDSSGVYVDDINELTPAAGVTIDGFLVKDGGFTMGGIAVSDILISSDAASASDTALVTAGYVDTHASGGGGGGSERSLARSWVTI